jgi:hypothetical protein
MMKNKIYKLIESAYGVSNKIQEFPYQSKGLNELIEWNDNIVEIIESIDDVYEQVKDGVGLLEAWEDQEIECEYLYENISDLGTPNLFFLKTDYEEIHDEILIDFISATDTYIDSLVDKLWHIAHEIIEIACYEYDFIRSLK